VLPRLTAVVGDSVVLDDRAAGILPVRNADPEKPALAILTLEAPVTVRVGFAQTAHAQLTHWGRRLACAKQVTNIFFT
jgi:hypothetical protein